MEEKNRQGAEGAAQKVSSIGGQAVMEGVMMQGKTAMAIAVRDADGDVRLETKRLKPRNKWYHKTPVIRGMVSFGLTFVSGIRTLMRSADVYGEGEPGRFEQWLSKKFKVELMTVVTLVAMVLGIGLAVGLFIVLPTALTNGMFALFSWERADHAVGYALVSGLFKILILLAYLLAVSLMKDIRRTFMYHGAEHKTISCYEQGLELTVENARGCTKLHQRCGTTFLFFVIAISVVVFILMTVIFQNTDLVGRFWLQMLVRIAMLPFVAGLAYELLKFLAKHPWKWLYPLRLPGLLLQKITTKEPDDAMLEVALTAFKAVAAMDADPAVPEVTFVTMKKTAELRGELAAELAASGMAQGDAAAAADFLLCEVLSTKRSGLAELKTVSARNVEKVTALAGRVRSGEPMQYVLGNVDFCGFTLKVTPDVLIPRFETELLAECAWKAADASTRVLDLCTGSGCIAVAVQKKSGCRMTACDISAAALAVAAQNAASNQADIAFIESDMLAAVGGEFDLIVSNPPYIPTAEVAALSAQVREYEPLSALDGGGDGLHFYRIIAQQAPKILSPGGVILLEVGAGQAQQVAALFALRFEAEIIKDLDGKDRIVKLLRRM